jgi:cytochrome c biogenesis protein ResB
MMRAYRFLARLDVAAVLILAVLLLAAFGSLFPQIPPAVAADAGRLARWESMARTRYGGVTSLLAAIGAFDFFRSPAFLVPLALLVVSTSICTLERGRSAWRRVSQRPVRCSASALKTAPLTACVSAPQTTALPGVLREGLERRGFRVRVASRGDVTYLRGDRNGLAPLATVVTHLAVLLLLLGVVLSWGYGWREEAIIEPGGSADLRNARELALRNEGFDIVRYSDGTVSSYEAELAIIAGGRDVRRGTLRVNEPLAHRGVWFYLRGYGGTEGRNQVTVLAVHDPGCALVITAGFLLLLGLTISFNFARCWIHAQIEPGGTLRLAGRAERRAYGFRREFAALVKELRQACAG